MARCDRIAFVCDLACLILFAYEQSLDKDTSKVFLCLFAAGMFLRASFYCSLALKIHAGWVASLIYGISLISLVINYTYVVLVGINIPYEIGLNILLVVILSALCMLIQFRIRLFRLALRESCLVRVFCRILILLLIFVSFSAYGNFCFYLRKQLDERDRIEVEKNVTAEEVLPLQD